jgi:CheY-like chemotaxis protein
MDQRATEHAGLLLLVEDDLDLREALGEILAGEGYDVVSTGDGLEALRRLQGGLEPSLILLDLILPGMNGWELLEHARGDRTLARIPVVLMTASTEDAVPFPRAAACLIKPFDVDELIHLVGELCPARRAVE